MNAETIDRLTEDLCTALSGMGIDDQVDALNRIRARLHSVGPFAAEPVDLVLWVNGGRVQANDYNPNRVAPPEMDLLRRSILSDGYTQPIVGFQEDQPDRTHTIVDGFHRGDIGKHTPQVVRRLHGYLPITEIRETQGGRPDRMASTIRHNRARGTHSIDLMVSIVSDLVQSGMSDEWICKNIGMDPDELLRLKQISGIAALFARSDFSAAWVTSETDGTFYRGTT